VIPFLAIPAAFKALPWLRIAFWIGIVVVIAIEALAIRAFYRKWQAEVEAHAKTRGEYAAFVGAVKARGEEAQAEARRIESSYREALTHAKQTHAAALAGRDADLRRLRERPPTDPGGRGLSIVALNSGRADGSAAQLVPLEDYRALEERAYDDARTLSELQTYLRTLGLPIQ
jgi:hypothetical protein